MARIGDYTTEDVARLGDTLNVELRKCSCMQEASQKCVEMLYSEFKESIVLTRIFMTLPFNMLPEADQNFARQIAETQNLASAIQDDSIMLSLQGTCGVEPSWNDRNNSEGHLTIPLISSDFVSAIPMISRLMYDMGIGLDWLDQRDTGIVVKTLGKLARVFYVAHAKSTLDEQGRNVVPASDFVEAYQVDTVFGLGGAYVNGPFAAVIFFTRDDIDRNHAELFLPLMTRIKLATTGFVTVDNIFP